MTYSVDLVSITVLSVDLTTNLLRISNDRSLINFDTSLIEQYEYNKILRNITH